MPILILVFAVSGCQPAAQILPLQTSETDQLTPYYTATATPTVTATKINAPTKTPQPTITPTPQIYILKGNETLWTIAAKAGLTLDEIKAANPGVNPYSLTAGMKIIIPAGGNTALAQSAATPTALPLLVNTPSCTPSLTGGFYCFATVENNQAFTVQNLVAQFVLTNPASGETQTQVALLPLDHLPVGSSLPFFAYFPPPVFSSPQVELQLLSASPDTSAQSTFLSLNITNLKVDVSADGLSASVKATATVAKAASEFWVAAVAYDAQGNVVAVRQLDQKTPLAAGSNTDFALYVYSIAGKIDHVALFGEATP